VPHIMNPSWLAAHTWHPMSYHPGTGLVYLSAQEQAAIYARMPDGAYRYQPGPGRTNTGQDFASHPELRRELQQQVLASEKGYLLAWDPVRQREAWRVTYPHPGSGGVLSTAGNLLVQGTIDKTLAIYRATDGRKLWEMNIDQAPVAGPVTYMVDGEQYIAINAGWGGSPVYNLGPFRTATAKLLVFKLGGTATLPPMPVADTAIPRPPRLMASEAQVADGRALFAANCSRCHGDNAVGGMADLRFMNAESHARFADVVLKGILADRGMIGFAGQLTPSEVEAIHAFLIARGNEDFQDASAK
jgi:quinohemoprotein ethanol dehydrogenase